MTNEVIRTLVGMKTNTTMQNRKKMQNSNNMNAKNLSGRKGLGGMYAMRSLVSGFFDFAEMQAKLHQHMYMADYMTLLEDLIRVNKRPVLDGKGHVSADQAKSHALGELKKFKERRLSPAEEDYMETIRALNQKAKENSKNN